MGRYGIKTVCRAFVLILLASSGSILAKTLTIRLVEAHNRSAQVDASLSDVAVTLKRNLPYTGFRQLGGTGTLALPAGGRSGFSGGYTVSAKGHAKQCQVSISKGKKALLNSTVSMQGKSPMILGGFPSGNGKHLFVLKLR